MPESKAPEAKTQEGAVSVDTEVADLGPAHGPAMRELAEDLPEKDEVQAAYKAQFLADDKGTEAKEKVKVVKASPDAEDTPSGAALIKAAGESNDTKRGEKYLREKTAKRWGYVPVE
jgi:hypothetical protein